MCSRSIGISWMWFGLSCSRSFTSSDADQVSMNTNEQQKADKVIQIPVSNGGPLVAAFGLTLSFAGLLTHVMVSILGAITLCAGLIAWFREVLPHEAHEAVTP